MSHKPEDTPKDAGDERLLARNKVLLDKDVFVNGVFVCEDEREAAVAMVAEYIYELEAINETSINDLVAECYNKSTLLQDAEVYLIDPYWRV